MKKNVSQQYKPFLVSRTALYGALLTGVLGFLMHPFVVFGYRFPDLGFITWFFLVPLFLGIHRHKFWHKFVLCFAAGTIMGYGKFYWLITAMQKFGGLNFFESFGALTFMCLFLGLLFGFFLALSSWTNHMTKIPLLFIVPLFMTSHDVLLHYFPFNGFPWGLPPYALGEWLAFFQWVDHTGLFGLSLFIYLINGLIAGSFLLFIHRRQLDKAIARFVVMVVLVVLSLFASSLASQQYEKNKTTVKHINLGLVQGNIPQDKKWDPYFAQDILNNYFALTHKAIKDGAQLVIWPETAYPFNLQYPNLFQEQFLNKEKLMTPLLIGAFVTERGDDALHWYNSVVQVNTDASMPRIYRKMHLVPFGEYLPLRRLLSFVPTITRAVGELTAGHQFDMFTFDDLSIGSLICFEDTFPRYARQFTRAGAQLLINYTNDAWYGNSSAQHQHLVFSQFRALENRRFLARATNSGMTAIITPRGEVLDKLDPFKESFLFQNIKLDVANSYYTQHGDTWVFTIVILSGLLFVYTIFKRLSGPVKIEF